MATILIVDDEHLTAEMLATFIKIIGHQAVEANSCKQAWDKLAYIQPDAILLDIMLPDQNGIEMLRELRAAAQTATVPVIMISAHAPPKTAEAEQAGANAYLVKPISLGTLREALAKVGVIAT